MNLLQHLNMSPEESPAVGTGTREELSADDILKGLNEDSNDLEVENDSLDNGEGETSLDKEKVKETSEEESEDENKDSEIEDELKELEEELKEPTDEDLELKTPVQRRALLKDYPDIFKKHPGLESTIYRERAYTELLPTIKDAEAALESVEVLNNFEKDLKSGNTANVLAAVKADDPQAFAKLADNYMINLAKVDEKAYHHVLGNITKDICEVMFKFAKDKGEDGKDVEAAASILYQFMFNSTKWEGKKTLASDAIDNSVSKEKMELEKQKQEWESSKQKEHIDKTMNTVNNQIKGTIEKSIDPKNQMTSFVKSKAVDEILDRASKLIKQDTRFQKIVDGLIQRAKKENFSEESLNRIRSAHFSKYNSILLPIAKAVKHEALKGVSARLKKDKETNDTTERANRDIESVRKNDQNKRNQSIMKPGMSYRDALG